MIQKIKKIYGNPRQVISIAFVVALIIGTSFYIIQKKNRDSLFAESPIVEYSQNAIAKNQSLTLAFPTGGRIKEISVKIGAVVKKGDILATLDSENALGSINQAKGAYTAAQTAYNKLINGSSNSEIEIARIALNNARNGYENTVAQQKNLVISALSNLHNIGLAAIPTNSNASAENSPIITGAYDDTVDGVYTLTIYQTQNGYYLSYSGLESGSISVNTVAVALGTKGLFIQLPNNFILNSNNTWKISIPNTQSNNYLANLNAYHAAQQNQQQAVSTAKGILDSAQANLDQKVIGARSEDLDIAKAQVESTKGALQIAMGIYNNTVITSPSDGVVTNVTISSGQIVAANAPVIEILSK